MSPANRRRVGVLLLAAAIMVVVAWLMSRRDSAAKRADGVVHDVAQGEQAADRGSQPADPENPDPVADVATVRVTVRLPHHPPDYLTRSVSAVPPGAPAAAEATTVVSAVRDGAAEFALAPGRYELRWYVSGFGSGSYTIEVTERDAMDVDLRDLQIDVYAYPHETGRLSVAVHALDGLPVPGAFVQVLGTSSTGDKVNQRHRSRPDGLAFFLLPVGDFIVSSRSWSKSVTIHPYTTSTVHIPGDAPGEYGELLVVSADDHCRVRRKEEGFWQTPTAGTSDGPLFLYLTPGSYDVGDKSETVIGEVIVQVGARARFELTSQFGTLVLRADLATRDTNVPSMIRYRVCGHSPGASYPNGYTVIWTTRQPAEAVLGKLEPGMYRVESIDEGYEFSTMCEVRSGKKTPVDVVFRPIKQPEGSR